MSPNSATTQKPFELSTRSAVALSEVIAEELKKVLRQMTVDHSSREGVQSLICNSTYNQTIITMYIIIMHTLINLINIVNFPCLNTVVCAIPWIFVHFSFEQLCISLHKLWQTRNLEQ